jgi:hypothetical protein
MMIGRLIKLLKSKVLILVFFPATYNDLKCINYL